MQVIKMKRRFKRMYCENFLILNIFCAMGLFVMYTYHPEPSVKINVVKTSKKQLEDQHRLRDWLSERNNESFEVNSTRLENNLGNFITVLMWTKYFGEKPLVPILHRISYFSGIVPDDINRFVNCPKVRCHFTSERSTLSTADAVVFHAQDLKGNDIPLYHREDQPWIFLQQESVTHTRTNLLIFKNVFNWTMTYRKDSDLHIPYGKVILTSRKYPKDQSSVHPIDEFQKSIQISSIKTKLIAWTVSNCETESEREKLVYELQKYVPVDIYGKCGELNCLLSKSIDQGCHNEIEINYKFYLSFENSLCTEYVTEKFYNALNRSIIPIVYGYENYSEIAPPRSFIDARSFNSVKDLAKYILHLDKNLDEYLSYFEWKKYYKVIIPYKESWCDLCTKVYINNLDGWEEKQWYSDLFGWWNSKANSSNVSKLQNTKNKYVIRQFKTKMPKDSLFRESHDSYESESVLSTACIVPNFTRENYLVSKIKILFKNIRL